MRRGAAIDLVLDRGRENRSQFVFTRIRGRREAIFWQTARTSKQARPHVSVPTARAAGTTHLQVLVDVHERYAWAFSHQQVETSPHPLPAGDYGVELDGEVVAVVERKSLVDLVSTLTRGRMRYLLGHLAALPRAAVVVEDRFSSVMKLERVRPAVVLDGLGECQARFPSVPIMFCENRSLAQEWTYRFLAAALHEIGQETGGAARLAALPKGLPLDPPAPSTAEVRAWARKNGIAVPDRGRLRPDVWQAFGRPEAGKS